ncbi:hypothetical protein F4555_000843 [Mobiluncus mulieris]|nr:hypothetical protein [Mobiluncus mulieris]
MAPHEAETKVSKTANVTAKTTATSTYAVTRLRNT